MFYKSSRKCINNNYNDNNNKHECCLDWPFIKWQYYRKQKSIVWTKLAFHCKPRYILSYKIAPNWLSVKLFTLNRITMASSQLGERTQPAPATARSQRQQKYRFRLLCVSVETRCSNRRTVRITLLARQITYFWRSKASGSWLEIACLW